ncbi:hypothetical protein [Niallia sp. 03133]|uniref:hypothetical protein n=1 Tax=Niallia sp. 03133 TaxID=3458060 RepID=UPI004044BE32
MIMNETSNFKMDEALYFLIKQLIEEYAMSPEVTENGTNKQKIESICTFIEAHYNERITLHDLASISNMNKYLLLRYFTRIRGITLIVICKQYVSMKQKNY